jgi:hypothetical protein
LLCAGAFPHSCARDNCIGVGAPLRDGLAAPSSRISLRGFWHVESEPAERQTFPQVSLQGFGQSARAGVPKSSRLRASRASLPRRGHCLPRRDTSSGIASTSWSDGWKFNDAGPQADPASFDRLIHWGHRRVSGKRYDRQHDLRGPGTVVIHRLPRYADAFR